LEGVVWCPEALAEKMGLDARREHRRMNRCVLYSREEMEGGGVDLKKGSERKNFLGCPTEPGHFRKAYGRIA